MILHACFALYLMGVVGMFVGADMYEKQGGVTIPLLLRWLIPFTWPLMPIVVPLYYALRR